MDMPLSARRLTGLLLLTMISSPLCAAPPSAEEDSFDLRQVLLRQSSVTVSPGQWQVDLSLNYGRTSSALPDSGKSVARDTVFDDNLRLGLTDRIEIFGGIPVAYARRETTDTTAFHQDSVTDIGDASVGASTVIARESDGFPGTIFTLAASFPTGKSPYDREKIYGAYTGSGHTSVRGQFDFVHSSDPIVMYWGAGYQYSDSASGWGSDIKPGGAIVYHFGIGFEVNRDSSLLAEMQGSYQFDTKVDGKTLDGSISEPVTLKVGVTTRLSRSLYIEPAVTFGLTSDAPDFTAGVAFISRGMF